MLLVNPVLHMADVSSGMVEKTSPEWYYPMVPSDRWPRSHSLSHTYITWQSTVQTDNCKLKMAQENSSERVDVRGASLRKEKWESCKKKTAVVGHAAKSYNGFWTTLHLFRICGHCRGVLLLYRERRNGRRGVFHCRWRRWRRGRLLSRSLVHHDWGFIFIRLKLIFHKDKHTISLSRTEEEGRKTSVLFFSLPLWFKGILHTQRKKKKGSILTRFAGGIPPPPHRNLPDFVTDKHDLSMSKLYQTDHRAKETSEYTQLINRAKENSKLLYR